MTLTISDAIAVKIINGNTLLAGVGNELHLYSDDKAVGTQVVPVKLRGKIHGIELGKGVNADKLLVYGEKEFVLLELSAKHKFYLLYRGRISDWISSAAFLLDQNEFVLLTAHSVVLRFPYSQKDSTCSISQRSSCSDKSTLYCSAIYGERWNELVIFGNAFGELLIWQPDQLKASLLQRIPSHNGVIFSINYNARANLLTTTSDDRSVRLWAVDLSPAGWADTKLTPLASGFGHIARVFQGRIVQCLNQSYVVTVGEDSYICVWRTTGELLHKCRQQFGATIWNFDYDEESQTLYTVGSTGNVLAYGLQDLFCSNDKLNTSILPSLNINKSSEEYMAKIKFITPNILVGITNKNRLVYRNINDENDPNWKVVESFHGYKCTVLEVYKNTVALCGYKRLTLFRFSAHSIHFDKYFDSEILCSVIRAFQFFTENNYIISDEAGNCRMLMSSSDGQLIERVVELPQCKEPWLTSAAMVGSDYLLVSNRQGNMFLYRWIELSNIFELTDTLKHPHGHLGATLIMLESDSNDSALLKSAGHDGSIKYLKIHKQSSKLSMFKRDNVPVAWVETLERRTDCDLLLGFNDNHFVVWSKLHDFTVQVPCGGGHRCWDYCIFEEENCDQLIKLTFIKNKRVLLHQFKLFNKPKSSIHLPTRNMWHVKSCNVLESLELANSGAVITISSGDDNLIKISKYCAGSNELSQIAEVHQHISNVRSLKVLKQDDDNYLIFSGGGRAQLCITNLHFKSFLVEEKLNFTIKSQNCCNSKSGGNYNFDPETRIMSLDALPLGDGGGYHLFIGCSDGFVRKYHLDSEWNISLNDEIYYGRCILQVHLVDSLFLLIAATDGIIRFSNLNLSEVHLKLIHHTSGINAFDTHYNAETRELRVLTGGDDQDLVFSRLSLGDEGAPVVLETSHFSSLHTAQVTAAQISPCGRFAYSSGVDQNLFKVNLEAKCVAGRFHSCVADVKGVRLCSGEMCLLFGCGLQIHSFES